jgi:hypothetical protein
MANLDILIRLRLKCDGTRAETSADQRAAIVLSLASMLITA